VDAPLLSALPEFIELQSRAASEAVEALGDSTAPVLFSAHSLPVEDVERDDSYVRGLEAAADEVATRLGLPTGDHGEILGTGAFGASRGERTWLVAYQSRGARGGEWLGPDVDDVIAAAAKSGASGIVVVPLGFATDHMETRYDLDVVARQVAEDAGLAFVRSALPNADPALAAGVARGVLAAVGGQG
jgi:ferrochelatase